VGVVCGWEGKSDDFMLRAIVCESERPSGVAYGGGE